MARGDRGPLAETTAATEAEAATRPGGEPGGADLSELSILVVDDDEALCETLCQVLMIEGYRTSQSVQTGREALEAHAANCYDLVILDMQLPDIQGAELLPQLVDLNPDLEVLILTGHATFDAAIRSISPNTVGYLMKPVPIPHLLEPIAKIAARQGVKRENARLAGLIARAKQEWETTYDAIADPIAIAHVDGTIQRVNRAFSREFDLPFDQILGAKDWKILFGTTAPPSGWQERPALAQRRAAVDERRDLGVPGVFSLSQFPAELETGPAVVYVLRDVTTRKRIESELEESQRALRALLGNLPGMAYRSRFDPSRPMEFVSEGCLDLTECEPDRLMSGAVSYTELIHPKDRDSSWEEIANAVAAGRNFQLFYRLAGRSGATRWVWEQGRAILSAGGEVERLEGYIADITERHNMEEQTRHQEKMAALGLLAAGVAHEVGNPLASISGVTQTLRRKIDDPAVTEKLDLIQDHVQRISKIVREMQDFARPPLLDWRSCDLGAILANAVELVRFDKRADDVEIELVAAETLRPTFGIEDQLLQLFLNVLLNALDAMHSAEASESRRLTITSGLTRIKDREAVRIEFQDRGLGIPEEVVGRVFDPFFTTKEVGYGTGLGLAVCYRIVEEHRGLIGIESDPTQGTRVTVTLPVLEAPPLAP